MSKSISRRWVVSKWGSDNDVIFYRTHFNDNGEGRGTKTVARRMTSAQLARLDAVLGRYHPDSVLTSINSERLMLVFSWNGMKHVNGVMMLPADFTKYVNYVPDMSPKKEECSYGYVSN